MMTDMGLTGTIPAQLGELVSLDRLDLDENQLTGSIPAELGKLEELRLEHNDLSGPVPWQLGNLENLEWLILTPNPPKDGLGDSP